MSIKRSLAIAATLAAGTLFNTVASSEPLQNVRGDWVILIDNTYDTLTIETQGGPGAPGALRCRSINGTLGIAPVRGYYCPDSGEIHFVHMNLDSLIAVRTFTGTVSQDPTTKVSHIAGTMHIVYAAFGNYGAYPFSANK